MKPNKNSRDAASPAPPSQQQSPIAAAFAPPPRRTRLFSSEPACRRQALVIYSYQVYSEQGADNVI